MTDRRRLNPPPGGTTAPIFALPTGAASLKRPTRSRDANTPRKIFLRTGLVPSASGSSYFEQQPSSTASNGLVIAPTSSLKLICTVHGPRPLPRNTPFSSTLLLSTHVKFAPFASRQRRGYIRDTAERDLGAHLETALRGVIIGERWPKSACEVVITVLEGEDDAWFGEELGKSGNAGQGQQMSGWGMMNVLAGCITAASAAIAAAGIDCVDLVAGGVAALPSSEPEQVETESSLAVQDPCPSEQQSLRAACVVGYMQSRDEITELWMKGDVGPKPELLIDQAVEAAVLTRAVLAEAVREAAQAKYNTTGGEANGAAVEAGARSKDTEMKG